MSDRRRPPGDDYFGKSSRPGQPALPPEQAKPTIKDKRQIDLVDACKQPPKTQKRR